MSVTEQLRRDFNATLEARSKRASEFQLNKVIPGHWFAIAAAELADMYIAGLFFGTITLSQAYVERLGKFIAEAKSIRISSDPNVQWKRLEKEGVASPSVSRLAYDIWARRNDFHHLNETMPSDHASLSTLARSCVMGVQHLESEFFSYSFSQGTILPANPDYWPKQNSDGLIPVFLRNTYFYRNR